MQRHDVLIGIGSNIGDRMNYLQQAVELLDALPGTRLTAVSSVYMTEPVGVQDQRPFFNAVARIETSLDPESLRLQCKAIERTMGRPREYERWSPRTIDLDILLYDDLCLKTELLVIPHSELHRRKFVLIPLLDLANPLHPLLQRWVSELLKTCGDNSVPVRLVDTLTHKKRTDC